jgi:hypothetical protein
VQRGSQARAANAPVELLHASDPLLDDELRLAEHVVRGGALQLRGLVRLLVHLGVEAVEVRKRVGSLIPVPQLQHRQRVAEPLVILL